MLTIGQTCIISFFYEHIVYTLYLQLIKRIKTEQLNIVQPYINLNNLCVQCALCPYPYANTSVVQMVKYIVNFNLKKKYVCL